MIEPNDQRWPSQINVIVQAKFIRLCQDSNPRHRDHRSAKRKLKGKHWDKNYIRLRKQTSLKEQCTLHRSATQSIRFGGIFAGFWREPGRGNVNYCWSHSATKRLGCFCYQLWTINVLKFFYFLNKTLLQVWVRKDTSFYRNVK